MARNTYYVEENKHISTFPLQTYTVNLYFLRFSHIKANDG